MEQPRRSVYKRPVLRHGWYAYRAFSKVNFPGRFAKNNGHAGVWQMESEVFCSIKDSPVLHPVRPDIPVSFSCCRHCWILFANHRVKRPYLDFRQSSAIFSDHRNRVSLMVINSFSYDTINRFAFSRDGFDIFRFFLCRLCRLILRIKGFTKLLKPVIIWFVKGVGSCFRRCV